MEWDLGFRPSAVAASLRAAALLLVAAPAVALPPVVTNPGDQTDTEGDPVSLQIQASDPERQTLSFSASGLPARLEIDPQSGLISPAINDDDVAGSYPVTVSVGAGGDFTQIAFQWTILPAELGSGAIFREYWTGLAGSAVSDLTSSPDYPDTPSGSDFQGSLQLPSNWGESHGTRLRGYVPRR